MMDVRRAGKASAALVVWKGRKDKDNKEKIKGIIHCLMQLLIPNCDESAISGC